MDTSPSHVDALLERYRAVASETMVQLHRLHKQREQWDHEREQWQDQCQTLQRALEKSSADNVRLMVVPMQATLRQAIRRIDHLLHRTQQADR